MQVLARRLSFLVKFILLPQFLSGLFHRHCLQRIVAGLVCRGGALEAGLLEPWVLVGSCGALVNEGSPDWSQARPACVPEVSPVGSWGRRSQPHVRAQ